MVGRKLNVRIGNIHVHHQAVVEIVVVVVIIAIAVFITGVPTVTVFDGGLKQAVLEPLAPVSNCLIDAIVVDVVAGGAFLDTRRAHFLSKVKVGSPVA